MGLEDSNHSHVSSISQGMSLDDVENKLGQPSEKDGDTYKWTCPGDQTKCISVKFLNGKVSE
ncbi:hypothetical protein FB639_005940, partial [Coemansia asiatica]